MRSKTLPLVLTVVCFSVVLFVHGCTKNKTAKNETTKETFVSKDYPIKPVPFTRVHVEDAFWAPRIETARKVTIPFAFKKAEETGRIDNFAKAGKLMEGKFEGIRYNDSDVFKIMEGAAYLLSVKPDPELDTYLDGVIAKVAAAQEPDGYLYTTRTIDPANPANHAGKERWTNLVSSHELYNVGHMYEAAVAHYLATGKRTFLDVAIKNADFLYTVFGPGKRHGYSGHQEIEIGLAKLYRVTKDAKYLELARFFLDERHPENRKYMQEDYPKKKHSVYDEDWYVQAHQKVVDQKEAVGHAVRATYMYSGMADMAALTGDKAYVSAINTIWQDVVSGKIYVTGGIGARSEGEAFGDAYELPNATAYAESCAAIGNILWNHRLFLLHGDAKYLDVMERTLYNGLLSGISLSGDLFFYPNPLESDGKKDTREPWFDCACCPVNFSRFLPSFPGYIYANVEDALYVNLFVAGKARIDVAGLPVTVTQTTNYPWDGAVDLRLEPTKPRKFSVMVRVPGWVQNIPIPSDLYAFAQKSTESVVLKINGKPEPLVLKNGFAVMTKEWHSGDTIDLLLPMPVRRVLAHEKVVADKNKVALQRGPLVYCFEGVDNHGKVLKNAIPDSMQFAAKKRPDLLGGITVLEGKSKAAKLLAVPYYSWAHRGQGEMAVWMRRDRK